MGDDVDDMDSSPPFRAPRQMFQGQVIKFYQGCSKYHILWEDGTKNLTGERDVLKDLIPVGDHDPNRIFILVPQRRRKGTPLSEESEEEESEDGEDDGDSFHQATQPKSQNSVKTAATPALPSKRGSRGSELTRCCCGCKRSDSFANFKPCIGSGMKSVCAQLIHKVCSAEHKRCPAHHGKKF